MVALYGVSRTPVREAMQSLNLLGVVDISPRRGATVRALPVEAVVDLAILSGVMAPDRSVRDVFEFRHAMESSIAELAATNSSEEDRAAIREILAENESAVARGDRERAQHVDVLFHAAIAEASGNIVFQAVAHALNGLHVELRRVIGGIPGASIAALAEHRDIYAAIADGDSEAARHAAVRHILNTRARYEQAQTIGSGSMPPRPVVARSARRPRPIHGPISR
jgi:DNA-binding FadR family transcriptional regulator